MAALRLLLFVAALAWPTGACAHAIDRWSEHVEEASARFGVPATWIRDVIRVESGGRTRIGGALTVSPAGAMGLMQLMPGTWLEMRSRLKLGTNPHDPRDNILAGTAYLRLLADRFGYPGAFAAYNAGPRRYADYLARRRSLPLETVRYAAKIRAGRHVLPRVLNAARPSLFARISRSPEALPAVEPKDIRALFVQLSANTE